MTTLFILMTIGAFITLAIQQGAKELQAELAVGSPEHKRVVSGRFLFYVVMSMYGIVLLLNQTGLL